MRIAQVNKGGSIPERSRQYLRDSFPETPHGVEGGKEGGKGKGREGGVRGGREKETDTGRDEGRKGEGGEKKVGRV